MLSSPPTGQSVAPPNVQGSLRRNPFLPPEAALVLKSLGTGHKLIFNKFCVVPQHMLIITDGFIHQDLPLSFEDFSACTEALRWLEDSNEQNDPEGEGWLFFYNSGPESGASQPHRHLQVIPGARPPIFSAIARGEERIGALDTVVYGLERLEERPIESRAGRWFETYQRLRQKTFLTPNTSYSLLFTKELMVIVPRKAESFRDISFNAMAFAGYFLAVYPEQLDSLLDEATDPVALLETLSIPKSI